MSERTQVNIRLERRLIEEIDALAREDAIDRSEMARRLLDTGLGTRRMQRALADYRRGSVSAWRAAEMAGVSLYEMLDRIHEEGIPHDLDPEVLERVEAAMGSPHAVHEGAAPYGVDQGSRRSAARAGSGEQPGIAELREQFRPRRVRVLFVGESSPAGGTHFYRADSNLFRATREAFALALGEEAVPTGPRFLREFQDRGCWLVDLADRPVDRLPAPDRAEVVEAGVNALARTISQVEPEHVVAVKATIAGAVRRAVAAADVETDLVTLPFPVRQWRAAYVRELAEALRRWEGGSASRGPARSRQRSGPRT